MKLQKILVGVDFSSYSDVARARAFKLARTFGAEVILFHACEDADYQGQRSWLLKTRTFEQLLESGRELARQQLDKLAEEGRAHGLRVTTELSVKSPDKGIIEAAQRHQVDLVAIGTHGRTGLQRLFLARIAERIVRNSPCSVLVARETDRPVATLWRLLVPTDFSEQATLAMETACSLVADDGYVDVLHCWLTYFYGTGYDGLYEESIALEPEMGKSIRRRGLELIEKGRSSRSRVSFEDRFASPVDGICQALEARPYDLVVMGSHSRHGLNRILLGSTAEATIRHANCSVLVVREHQ